MCPRFPLSSCTKTAHTPARDPRALPQCAGTCRRGSSHAGVLAELSWHCGGGRAFCAWDVLRWAAATMRVASRHAAVQVCGLHPTTL
jgi:hypothetical protein